VVGILGDQNLSNRRLGRQSALDQPRRRRRLHHHFLASPAGIFGPTHDQHPQLCRDDVEPFAGIFPDPVQRVAAARTVAILDVDDDLDARKMSGERSTIHAALGGTTGSFGRGGVFALSLTTRCALLDLFEPEQQLILRQRLGPATEAMALQLFDDLFQPLGTSAFRQQHRLERAEIVWKRVHQDRHGKIRSWPALRR
jgi:hypothetical protein